MPRVSKIGKLISENERLASLPKPFSEYYPYYVLIREIKSTLENFLINERPYVESMKISYRKPVEMPVDSSAFLPRLEDATVESTMCDNFCQFLHILMGNVRDSGDRSKIVGFDFITLDKIVKHYEFDSKDKYLVSGRIKEFWLRAKKCVQNNAQPKHTDLDFMDLVSAFCGYTSFQYFLDAKFGESYNSSGDKILSDLKKRYPISSANKDVQSQPKEKKSHELVPNAVAEPKTEYFLGREDDLVKITNQLQLHGTLVIQGEGGMGKTTVAAAYYHQSIAEKLYKTVAWLFCEQGTLKAIYELAYSLGLNFQGVAESDRLLMIQHKLKEMEGDFLLVLDNVGDDLSDFIAAFQGFRWNVLVTSRTRMDWDGINAFELAPLSTESAKALFKVHYQNRSGESLESGEEFAALLEKLISAIGQNTLVIEVFAKQLREEFSDENDGRFGLKEFLHRLEQQGLYLEESQETLRTNYVFYRRKNEVATTTEILNILYDFSKLDKILKSLLINVALLPADDHKLPTLAELFRPPKQSTLRANLKKLYAMGWLGGDGSTQFRISPVIQELAIKKHQETLWEEGKELVQRVSELIREEPDKDNMHLKFRWQPFTEKLASLFADSQEEEYRIFQISLATLLQSIGGRENLLRARDELERGLASDLKNFGENAPAVAIRRSNLAKVLRDIGGRGNLDRAEEELEKALASDLKNFGEDAPAVSDRRSTLAGVLQDLGGRENLNRAAEELEKALAFDLKNFSEDTLAVSTRRSNLALVLKDIGGRENLLRALEELGKALASVIKNLGEDAPTVSTFRSNLAVVLLDLGGRENLDRAAEELGKALASDLKNFGDDAQSVSNRRSNLAIVLLALGSGGNLSRAAEELKKALASERKNFGEDAPTVAKIRSNLAMVLSALGGGENLNRAAEELEKALVSDLKNFGEDSLAVSTRRSNLALVLKDLGGRENLLRALEELGKALASVIKNFGEDASVVSTVRSNRAGVLQHLGGRENLNRAAEEERKALASDLKNFGEDAPQSIRPRVNLAATLYELPGTENLLIAQSLLKKALTLSLHHFGEEHPVTKTVVSWLKLVDDELNGD